MAITIDSSDRKHCPKCEGITSHVTIEVDNYKATACFECMLDALEAATCGLFTEVEVED